MRIIVTVLALLPFLGIDALAQPKPWRIGEDGYAKWREHNKLKCVECKGKKYVKCHICKPHKKNDKDKPCLWCHKRYRRICQTCGGTGKTVDNMEKVRCLSCKDYGGVPCSLCRMTGTIRFAGSKKGTKCPACKGEGGYPCGLCHGKFWVSAPRAKGKDLRKAKLKHLEALMEDIDNTIRGLKSFNTSGIDKKSGPASWAKVTKPLARAIPEVRKSKKALEDALTTLEGGSRVTSGQQDHNSRVRTLMGVYLVGLAKILDEEKKLVQFALDAAKHDEKTKEEKKKKK